MQPIYQRVLLKISGEALAGDREPYNPDTLCLLANEILALKQAGVQCAVVVGAGNIWRGRHGGRMARTTADAMGMLATAINALAVSEAIRAAGGQTTVLSAVPMGGFVEIFSADRAKEALQTGHVVIFAAGSGNPYFSTDTAALLRALEIQADAVLLAKNVAGVFTADPKRDPSARMYREVSPGECIRQGLQAADLTAMTLAMENNLPLEVFALADGNMMKAACGLSPGTRITKNAPEGGIIYIS